jgi:hypothetical protein
MLVADVANQFLEQILEGHQPKGSAALVADDGEVQPLAKHAKE